jgi:hypothetical protein
MMNERTRGRRNDEENRQLYASAPLTLLVSFVVISIRICTAYESVKDESTKPGCPLFGASHEFSGLCRPHRLANAIA